MARPSLPGAVVTALLLGVFIAGLAGAVAATGWAETRAALARLGPGEVAALLLLSLANYFARALRWSVMARAMALPTGFAQDMRHYFAGLAVTATPGRVGELVRLRWLGRETGWPLDRLAPIAIADRAAELAAVAPLLALSVALSTVGGAAIWPLIAIALGAAFVATRPRLLSGLVTGIYRATGRWPRLFARARRMVAGLAPFSRPAVALPALALGFLGWFAEGLAFWLLLHWLGAETTLWAATAIFLAAILSGAMAGLPGGLGGTEAAMVGLLLLDGTPLDIALPATAVIRLTTLWFAILIGLGVFPVAEARARAGRTA